MCDGCTPHVTRHTSHVTRHTSHVTRHILLQTTQHRLLLQRVRRSGDNLNHESSPSPPPSSLSSSSSPSSPSPRTTIIPPPQHRPPPPARPSNNSPPSHPSPSPKPSKFGAKSKLHASLQPQPRTRLHSLKSLQRWLRVKMQRRPLACRRCSRRVHLHAHSPPLPPLPPPHALSALTHPPPPSPPCQLIQAFYCDSVMQASAVCMHAIM
jgi:hypothetical protein